MLYVFADRLDDDPWLLLHWRGRTRDELLAHLATTVAPAPLVAPWWPLVPGARLPEPPADGATALLAGAPGEPAAVLARCEPLAVDVRGTPVVDLLAAAYQSIVERLDD